MTESVNQSLSSRPLTLKLEEFEHSILIPSELHYFASNLVDQFHRSLVDNGGEPIASTLELFSRFQSVVLSSLSTCHPHEKNNVIALIQVLAAEFENRFLVGNNIHKVVALLDMPTERRIEIIKHYYAASQVLAEKNTEVPISLFQSSSTPINVFAVFGGQGVDDYISELKEIFHVYNGIIEPFLSECSATLKLLSGSANASRLYSKGLDVLGWLRDESALPDQDYLTSAPVSLPMIGLVQLCSYLITVRLLGLTPESFRGHLKGVTGHSQGIISAVVIASATDWDSFQTLSLDALTTLFWIGCRSQQVYPRTSLRPLVLQDSVDHLEGVPTPMLSVRDLPESELIGHINATNKHLPADRKLYVSLVNGPRNFVVAGPPQSLYGLNTSLRKVRAGTGMEQNRIPFSERKIKFSNRFLPITVPFHSGYLEGALETILTDLQHLNSFRRDLLQIPVFNTYTGGDIRDEQDDGLLRTIVELIVCREVNWELATRFTGATHVLDFGPGGTSGIGVLTHKNKEGTGVRVILAGAFGNSNSDFGYKDELFDCSGPDAVKFAMNWESKFRPTLSRTPDGGLIVNTKLSRLIGKPPLIVAGMTPSTVPWDFVAATMNAGFHIELAGGGYYNEKGLSEALQKIEENTVPGSGICINLIYVNPKAMGWQIPLIGRLRAEGVPIEGLTIGAGVPSLEVANGYIRDLGLKHISFKPGSVEGIEQVIKIAMENPHFPVICQWTGGRGGGHHSFEDFHQPILSTYAALRRCPNLVLVAGSGFGDHISTLPYLTGDCSLEFKYPRMPFDGVLFGSRVMVAKEAHTSTEAKKAIVEATGVQDRDWESTYKRPTGGVITVLSEMGEPIHKLATRGVLLWAEMDKMIFSVEKKKRGILLKEKKNYIIKRLNDDFQKIWFGIDGNRNAVDLEDMTYGQIVLRLVELMHVRKENRWIHPSLKLLTAKFIRRVEERFANADMTQSLLPSVNDLNTPYEAVDRILENYPRATEQLINAQDLQFFLQLCKAPGQKPVPFVPALDDDFEFWFKKDSLWQSEDIAAVVGNDVGRVCILHGPVAARFSKTFDEPIKQILDEIHEGHVSSLLAAQYSGNVAAVEELEFLQEYSDPKADADLKINLIETTDKIMFSLPLNGKDGPLPETTNWLEMISGCENNWRKALILSETIVQGTKYISNPFKRVFKPMFGRIVTILQHRNASDMRIRLSEKRGDGSQVLVLEASYDESGFINVELLEHRSASNHVAKLLLKYRYTKGRGTTTLQEVMRDRNERIKLFYSQLWFGDLSAPLNAGVHDSFVSDAIQINQDTVAEFLHVVGNNGEAFVPRSGKQLLAPMDFAIVVGWKAIIKAIFPRQIDGDLLRLVHLSNSFRALGNEYPLRVGDEVTTKAYVNAVLNQPAGKMVEVRGILSTNGKPAMEVVSRFLYRGKYQNFASTFEKRMEVPKRVLLASTKDVAVLRSKDWFKIQDSSMDLLNKTLTFRLTTMVEYNSKDVFKTISTKGPVLLELPTKEIIEVATVDFSAQETYGNPVLDYLNRFGTAIEQPLFFDIPISLHGSTKLSLRTPSSNEPYARVSSDYNPIHVSDVFSSYVGLPGTITHGMYTSAAVRGLIEIWAAENIVSRVRKFSCEFVGMVNPNDDLEVKLDHIGMISGRKIIHAEVFNVSNMEKVLTAKAEVEQPVTAYVFTGQGSQEQNMGMDLYKSSAVAREVWDRADRHFLENYGFSILHIVRANPKELTVHFGGARGRTIRDNYVSMTFETVGSDGTVKSERIFKDIDHNTTSYTYRSPTGLLSATQFTQPALTLMEKASFEDMRQLGLVQKDSVFAGHSLGEYSALAALADVMPIESLVSVVFYRGLTMQVAVERDSEGRSNYGMCAVNPSRVAKSFDEVALQVVVQAICTSSNWLLEVVNFNVSNQQYVCAGDLRALECLGNVLNYLKQENIDLQHYKTEEAVAKVKKQLAEIVRSSVSLVKQQSGRIELKRGHATIPLRGIDVPFHSSFLRSGVKPFRNFLLKKIPKSAVDPARLVGKYIPNVTALPFEISKEYCELVHKLTGSPKIANILANWHEYSARQQ